MHSVLFLLAVALAWGIRYGTKFWPGRLSWGAALAAFALPPLMLITTSGAIVVMGCGEMFGVPARMGSHLLAWLFLGWTTVCFLDLAWQTIKTLRSVQDQPQTCYQGQTMRLLATEFPYSAQIGLWSPELVVSQGLLHRLSPTHLAAVLAHENAHITYRDTLTFFVLGGLRRLTAWLPQTEALWQELLWQRECRADRKAAESCDPLVLAEALALVAQAAITEEVMPLAVPFHSQEARLLARIDQLLAPPSQVMATPLTRYWISFSVLAIALGPLLFIPWHSK
ncbi:MAG: M56 family metallopeptidase [Synechocystis sp.]